jgi:hypothetical protein
MKPSHSSVPRPGGVWHQSPDGSGGPSMVSGCPGRHSSRGSRLPGSLPNSSAAMSRILATSSGSRTRYNANMEPARGCFRGYFTEGLAAGNDLSRPWLIAVTRMDRRQGAARTARVLAGTSRKAVRGRCMMPGAKNKKRSQASRRSGTSAQAKGPAVPLSGDEIPAGLARRAGDDVPAGLAPRAGEDVPAGLARRAGSDGAAKAPVGVASGTAAGTRAGGKPAGGATAPTGAAGKPVGAVGNAAGPVEKAAGADGQDDVPQWAAKALEQLLTVTYWLDPGERGAPFSTTIRFTGYRTDVAGTRRPSTGSFPAAGLWRSPPRSAALTRASGRCRGGPSPLPRGARRRGGEQQDGEY